MPDPSTLSNDERAVFVYGTLRRGGSNDITLMHPAPRWLGSTRVAGQLFHLGAYPGMLLGGAGDVLGEVYAISHALEEQLDVIEGLGGPDPHDEYVRREIDVTLPAGVLRCLVYEINLRRLADAPQIAHGDWIQAVALPSGTPSE